MKTLTRDKRARHQPGYNRRRRNERQQKLRIAGIPQIEDSHLLDGSDAPGPDQEAELAKVIAAACERFKVNHQPAPERVPVVEEVDCDD